MSAKKTLEYGAWIDNRNINVRDYEESRSPYSGQLVARIGISTEREMEKAIQSAVRAFPVLKAMPSYQRYEILMNVSRFIKENAKELTRLIALDAGKPIQFAEGEVARAAITFALSAEEVRREVGAVLPIDIQPRVEGYSCVYIRVPRGPVGAISPFNFPLNLVAHKLGPAFAAGCPVVLKAPPQCPATPFVLAEIFKEAGAPPGAFNVLHCEPSVAEKLATGERLKVFSFTGSSAVGWMLKSKARKKKVLLELGGNAAAVVHKDVKESIDWIASRLAFGSFAYAGQVCISVQRIYVQKDIFKMFEKTFVEKVKALPYGNPLRRETVVGPLIDAVAADRVEEWVNEALSNGAKAVIKGTREGNVVSPWVLKDVDPGMKISCEEVFGPVAVLYSYDEFEEAIDEVNNSVYGLQAGIFTRDVFLVRYALENIEAGGIVVNDFPTLRVDNYPYGGMKDSGFGREGVHFAYEEMTELKAFVFNWNMK